MKWAKQHDVFVADMLEPLKKMASSSLINLPDGHFNAVGNQVIAEEIHTFLKRTDLLQDWSVK